jgi:L-ascorbate metabolism protein UlaG (beta-lactamase superfamily)
MKLTYYGHSCFAVEINNKHILFDPFISDNPLAKEIDIENIKADYIFISHAHFDHTADVVRIASRTGATVVGNWEINAWLVNNNIVHTRPMNPGGKCKFDFGLVRCVIAQHSSSFPDGAYGGTAAGYVVETREGNFYYSGDTGITLDMKLIPEWTTVNFAVFPIGGSLTMGIDDAIMAASWLSTKHVVGVHYDTFEQIKIEHADAIQKFKEAGIKLHLLQIGSVSDL